MNYQALNRAAGAASQPGIPSFISQTELLLWIFKHTIIYPKPKWCGKCGKRKHCEDVSSKRDKVRKRKHSGIGASQSIMSDVSQINFAEGNAVMLCACGLSPIPFRIDWFLLIYFTEFDGKCLSNAEMAVILDRQKRESERENKPLTRFSCAQTIHPRDISNCFW